MAFSTVAPGRALVLNLPAVDDVPTVVFEFIPEALGTETLNNLELAQVNRITSSILQACLEANQNHKLDRVLARILHTFVVEISV